MIHLQRFLLGIRKTTRSNHTPHRIRQFTSTMSSADTATTSTTAATTLSISTQELGQFVSDLAAKQPTPGGGAAA